MIRLNRGVAAVLAAILLAAPAAANDSVASMGAGGLVLQRTDGIEMRSEDLYVSAAEIRVRYRFYNRTERDIATLVAFPMPDLQGGIESDVAIEDPLRMPFTTTVNGRRVATNVEQKAIFNGVDHSDMMRGLGVPLSPRGEATMQALASLPRPQIEMLIEMVLWHLLVRTDPPAFVVMMMATGFAIGVMIPAIGINYLYQRKSLALFLIDAGHFLFGMAAMGGVFISFRG